jgi:hypothetical protein
VTPRDYELVNRLAARLDAAGPEALYLRNKLLLALIGAAELAGDKGEARQLAREHTELCRARARAGGQ